MSLFTVRESGPHAPGFAFASVVAGARRRRDGLARPGRWLPRTPSSDTGATTAEFAIVTMAAVGFAGLLVVILKSDAVRGILEDLVHRALTSAG